MGFYVLQVYIPCIMLVILSWVAFFINREATSDRSCIGIEILIVNVFSDLIINAKMNAFITKNKESFQLNLVSYKLQLTI